MTKYFLDSGEMGENAAIPTPKLGIVMVTCNRTDLALRTIQGVADYLVYPKEMRQWYIADDGSPPDHMDAIFKRLEDCNETLLGFHSEKFMPGTHFPGRGWNLALRRIHEYADFVLWLEDDWELTNHVSISDYVRLLLERNDVGLVRMGGLAVGSDVGIVGYRGKHYLKYLRNTQYAYSGNPLIRHRRFLDAYGFFAEDRSPGEIELAMDDKFRLQEGPDIWRPVELGGWGVWGHIGREKTW